MYSTTQQACKQLNIDPQTLRALAKAHKIEYFSLGREKRYDVNKFLKDNVVNTEHGAK